MCFSTDRASGIMMPAMKGLDPANLRANLRKTTQPDPAKKVCTITVHQWFNINDYLIY